MTDYGGQSTVTLAAATEASVFPPRFGRRRSFSIANVGGNPAYVDMSDGETAVAGSGIYLAPGGVLTDSDFGTYKCWQGAITAVSTAGTSLSCWERVAL